MVCLPVSRPTNSSTIRRRSSSLSPVWVSRRMSTIMGTMTSIQPARMSEMVPSKSKRTTRAFLAETPGRRCSIIFSIVARTGCGLYRRGRPKGRRSPPKSGLALRYEIRALEAFGGGAQLDVDFLGFAAAVDGELHVVAGVLVIHGALQIVVVRYRIAVDGYDEIASNTQLHIAPNH